MTSRKDRGKVWSGISRVHSNLCDNPIRHSEMGYRRLKKPAQVELTGDLQELIERMHPGFFTYDDPNSSLYNRPYGSGLIP